MIDQRMTLLRQLFIDKIDEIANVGDIGVGVK